MRDNIEIKILSVHYATAAFQVSSQIRGESTFIIIYYLPFVAALTRVESNIEPTKPEN